MLLHARASYLVAIKDYALLVLWIAAYFVLILGPLKLIQVDLKFIETCCALVLRLCCVYVVLILRLFCASVLRLLLAPCAFPAPVHPPATF